MHDLSKGKILVTGGAGLIGSAIIWKLNELGYTNIITTDKLGTDLHFKNLVPLQFEDYIEYEDFDKILADNPSAFSDVKTVFHLGACSATTEKDCTYLIHNNYEYTKKLALWALSNNARFVYASSAATYGNGENGMNDTDSILPLRPLNMYGYSKHLFDLYALKNNFLDKITGVKYFNVFGPNENHKAGMVSMVYRAFNQIKETGAVRLFKSYRPEYKDGCQMRDFLYVKDAVDITIHLAKNPSATGLFNVGSGKAQTWLDLIQPIFETMNKPQSIEYIEMPETLRSQYQYFTEANLEKLKRFGGDKFIRPLHDAVTDYVKNYLLPDKHLGER